MPYHSGRCINSPSTPLKWGRSTTANRFPVALEASRQMYETRSTELSRQFGKREREISVSHAVGPCSAVQTPQISTA